MTATLAESLPQERLEQEALTIPQRARGILVKDQASLDEAGCMLTDVIKPLRKQAAEVFNPIIAAAHKSHAEALAGKAKVEKPLIEAEDILKRSVGGYLREQERIRSEEENRLRREQREREEREAKEAEARRIEEEKALNEQIAREHAEEVERQLEALPANTPAEVVRDICTQPEPEPIRIAPEMPVFMSAVTVAPRVVTPTGVSTTQKWKAEVFSVQLLCRAIADGKIPANFIEPNMTALNAMARANKQALNVPGVRAVADTTVSARSR